MTWVDEPLLTLDVETTGLDRDQDRVVEIAIALIDPTNTVTSTWHRIINPGINIPDDVAALHGLTNERATAEGLPPAVVFAELGTILTRLRHPVVVYNARFDVPFVDIEADRHHVDLPRYDVLDPLVCDKHTDRYRKGSRKLVDTASLYGIEFTGAAHGALADCVAAGQLMRAIGRKYPQVGEATLQRLHHLQLEWEEEQRSSFVTYMRTKATPPDPTFTKRAGWPIPYLSLPA